MASARGVSARPASRSGRNTASRGWVSTSSVTSTAPALTGGSRARPGTTAESSLPAVVTSPRVATADAWSGQKGKIFVSGGHRADIFVGVPCIHSIFAPTHTAPAASTISGTVMTGGDSCASPCEP